MKLCAIPKNDPARPTNTPHSQSGNAFFFILLGIVLFAALSFTIARGMRSQTTSTLSARELELAASDIVTYTQKIARGVDRVRRGGCSENEINFDNGIVTATYVNASAPGDNSCDIFHPNGGVVTWLTSPVSNRNYQFSAAAGVQSIGTAGSELIITLDLTGELELCQRINQNLGLTAAPANEANDDSFAAFTGTFTDSVQTLTTNAGQQAACFDEDGTGAYRFYSVLLVR